MNDQSTLGQGQEYETLSRRLVDIVLETLGPGLEDSARFAPQLLRRAQTQVRAELAGRIDNLLAEKQRRFQDASESRAKPDGLEEGLQHLEKIVRQRTAALQVSHARFQAVFEEAAIGIALVDHKGQILDSNPALQRMLGYEKDELEGLVFSGLAHPDNVTDDALLYNELMAGKRSYYRVEGRYMGKDGRPIDANLTVSLVHPIEGQARFAIALVEDVTEQKRAQAALVESEKLAITGRIAASLAHEINNPLQSVIGLLSLAEEDLGGETQDLASLPAGDKSSLQYITIALEELERVARLVGNLRDLNRPIRTEQGRPTDVNELVERVLALTRKRCETARVEVVWRPAANLPALSLLPGRIQQVFLNLVLNAIDAMPDGGRLQVSTELSCEPRGIQIHFTDDGVGVAASDNDRLFAPFYTTKSLGMGLGLYVSQGIVQDHRGHIEIASREKKGTTFTVWLPA